MTLYVHDRPVAPPRFVGRETTVRAMLQGLHKKRSFALLGGPCTGKTSTLLLVRDKLAERWVRNPKGACIAVAYVDLATVTPLSPARLLEVAWEAMVGALMDARFGGPVTRPLPKMRLAPRPSLHEQWATLGHQLHGALRDTPAWREVVLLLDNADAVLAAGLHHDPLWQFLLQAGLGYGPSAVVVAGSRALREHLLDQPRVGTLLRPLHLGALNEAEAEQLIKMAPVPLEAEERQMLWHATGGHPYVLQRVLARVEEQGEDVYVDGAIDGVYSELARLFARLWDAIDFGRHVAYQGAYAAPEHALMGLLVEEKRPMSLREVEGALAIRPMREYAELLEYLGVVTRALHGNEVHYRAGGDLWNAWYADRASR